MVKIDFEIEFETSLTNNDGKDFTETDIDFSIFLGNVIFVVDGCDFSARWHWVPVVGFLRCFADIIKRLEAEEGVQAFQFTESEAEILFERSNLKNNLIAISANYVECRATTTLIELKEAFRVFRDGVVRDLFPRYPWLANFVE